jgi:hypothetical protein
MAVNAMAMDNDEDAIALRNARERRKRNIAVAMVLAGMVILFFLMTIVRLGGHVFDGTM